jgi:PIN domain nuclease of toxin-antitoxin system
MILYLDTQVMVWLCQKRLERLTARATKAISESDLLISPMVLLELEYLHEIKKVVVASQVLLKQLAAQIGLRVCDHPFAAVIDSALHESWTRDPFDRVIVAHAKSNGHSALVTADAKIRAHYRSSVW